MQQDQNTDSREFRGSDFQHCQNRAVSTAADNGTGRKPFLVDGTRKPGGDCVMRERHAYVGGGDGGGKGQTGRKRQRGALGAVDYHGLAPVGSDALRSPKGTSGNNRRGAENPTTQQVTSAMKPVPTVRWNPSRTPRGSCFHPQLSRQLGCCWKRKMCW